MEIERNLGTQPIAAVLEAEGLRGHDLVELVEVGLTHKMVSRACKGRRLTKNSKSKVKMALEKKTGKSFEFSELFNY